MILGIWKGSSRKRRYLMEVKLLYNPKPEEVDRFVEEMLAIGEVSFDIETTGLDCYLDKILMLQFALPTGLVLVLTESLPKNLLEGLENVLVIGHNLKFDYKFGRHYFNLKLNRVWDTMIVDGCLSLGKLNSVSLEAVALRRLGVKLDKSVRSLFINRTNKNFTEREIQYAIEDVLILFKIREAQKKELDDLVSKHNINLEKTIALENETVLVTGDLEYNGVGFDRESWSVLLHKTEKEVLSICKRIYAIHPYKKPVKNQILTSVSDQISSLIQAMNLNSSVENLRVLNHFGAGIESTEEKVLRSLNLEIAKLLLEYREKEKLLTAFLRPVLNEIHPVTGNFHPEYTQISLWDNRSGSGTVTGRYSCRRWQQMPKLKELRNCFIAKPGNVIITADYSSVEVRIAGNISLDPVLIKFFNSDFTDYHGYTAHVVFKYPIEEVSNMVINGVEVPAKNSKVRAKAKNTNFGLIYKITKYGLSKQLDCSLDEAQSIIDAYYSEMPELMRTIDGFSAFAVKHGFIHDHSLGRVRWFPAGTDPFKIERPAANMPFQGTSASQMKLALTRVRKIKDITLRGTVHDEIVAECPQEVAEERALQIRDIMIQSANDILSGPIPYDVSVSIEPYWTK